MQINAFSAITKSGVITPDDSDYFMNSADTSVLKFRQNMRNQSEAILVGMNTILSDDPGLMNETNSNYRVVVDSRQGLTGNEKIFQIRPNQTIVIVPNNCPKKHVDSLRARGAAVYRGPRSDLCTPHDVAGILRRLAFCNVIIEGGPKTIARFVDSSLVDSCWFVVFDDGGSNDGARLPGELLALVHKSSTLKVPLNDHCYAVNFKLRYG